jgi:cobalt transporter subunit CbtB
MTTKTIAALATVSSDTSEAGVYSERITTGVIMLLTGSVLLFAVGFAQGSGNFMHNAAHDSRHAATFPCH